ncbi:MAG: hypothetical protein GX542_10520 [Rhodococcus sp.]|nr:hypothetical protein [Rhodococcus sp. (in: high G+C Gram-positive bacteria)]
MPVPPSEPSAPNQAQSPSPSGPAQPSSPPTQSQQTPVQPLPPRPVAPDETATEEISKPRPPQRPSSDPQSAAADAKTQQIPVVPRQTPGPRGYGQDAPTEQFSAPPTVPLGNVGPRPPQPNLPPRRPVNQPPQTPHGFTPPPARPVDDASAPQPASAGGGGGGFDGLRAKFDGAPWPKIAVAAGGVAAVLGLGYLIDLAVTSGSVPRGTTVAGVAVGGMSPEEAEQTLRSELEPRTLAPVEVNAGDVTAELVPAEAGLGVDWDATLSRIDSQPLNPWTRFSSFFVDREAGVDSTVDEAALTGAVDSLREGVDRPVREGNIVFEGANPVAVAPEAGQQIDGDGAAATLTERWAFAEPVSLPVEVVEVTVTQESVDRALNEVAIPAASADLVVTGHGGKTAKSPRGEIGSILRFEPDGDGGLNPVYDVDAATNILAPQLESTEKEPKDASITLSGGFPTVVPAVVGELVAWPKTLEGMPDALVGNHQLSAVYDKVEPELTTEAAEKLGVREVIGEFTTGGFSSASGVNIRLAAASLNGALVKPGETFSLNDHTGPRGTAQGYIESGIINNGRPDTAVGGGVSQVATTLYNASYFAGMEDAGHTEHSYYISRYPEAREATVFEGAIDLKFRNPTDTGVYIEAIGGSSQLTIRMWGTKTVTVESVTGQRTNPTQPQTIRLPAGPDCIASTGSPGFTSSDTRIIREVGSGREISRNTRTVRYDPVPTVECVAPEPAADAPPASGGGAPSGGAPVSGNNGGGNGGGAGGISIPNIPRIPSLPGR